MDTIFSEQRVAALWDNPFQSKREARTFYHTFKATPERLFPLLCAAREADWLEGTGHEIVYSQSGYAEEDYIFKSDFFGLGLEVWVRYEHRENESLAYVRVGEDAVVKFEIALHDNYDGTVATRWRVTYTGLNAKGNEFIGGLPDKLPLKPVMDSLQHYLDHGTMKQGG